MMPYSLTEEQAALRDMAARVASEIYAPMTLDWDLNRTPLPAEERRRLGSLGLLGLALPEDVGGSGAGLLEALLVIEELGKECQTAAFAAFEANVGPARVVDLYGSSDQKARLLPPVVAGEATIALAISEPDAGSAATDLTTRAEQQGRDLVINGTKRWCSGAGHAEQYLVYVRLTDVPGHSAIGAVIVDGDSPGLTFGPRERLMGFSGVPSADMYFRDVHVPADNLILGAGSFRRLFGAFSIERLGNATMSLAIGQACLDRCVRYVQEREQFGRQIIDFQLVQASLAEMVMQVSAARLLIWKAAAETPLGGHPGALDASVAKCFANEMAKVVSDLAIQLHGGYGYSTEYGIERLHRDAHGWAIAGGTSSMQRIRIASEYTGHPFSQRK